MPESLKNEAFKIDILFWFRHVYKGLIGVICQSGRVFCNLTARTATRPIKFQILNIITPWNAKFLALNTDFWLVGMVKISQASFKIIIQNL